MAFKDTALFKLPIRLFLDWFNLSVYYMCLSFPIFLVMFISAFVVAIFLDFFQSIVELVN